MPAPIVAIIIPSFNRELLITETLDSVLAQTFTLWEAIVVDDGSIDNTCAIVQAYAERDSRITLLKRNREPKGASVCRNIGIEYTKAKYAVFLDSDDLIAPACLEKRVEFLDSHPELNFAVFQMVCFNDKGINENIRLAKKRDNYLYSYLSHDLPWHTTCPIWNIDFVRNQLKGFNESYLRLQDPEFNTRALLVKDVRFEVLYDSAPDSYYRDHLNKSFNVSILLNGFKLYLLEFIETTAFRNDEKACKEHLKECYIEAVRSFYSYYEPKYHKESITLINEMMRGAYRGKVIGAYTCFLTELLIKAYSLKLSNSKNGRLVLRSIMKLIKIS